MGKEDTIREIKKKLRTRENGPASEAMGNLGIKYKRNHGLSVKQIKDIAAPYLNDHELAVELFKEDIREFRIMSFVIEDAETVSEEQVNEWVCSLTDSEQAEQIAINLLVFNNKFYKKINDWVKSDNQYVRRTAFVLIARIAMLHKKNYPIAEYKKLAELCRIHADDESIIVAKAISWGLRRIARLDKKLYYAVLEISEELNLRKIHYTQLIAEEIKYELNDGMIKSMIF